MAMAPFGLLLLASCAAAWTTFTVPHADDSDDTLALIAALATGSLSNNATILFAKGVKYNISTPIKFPVLNNVEVRIEGNLSLPDDIPTVQSMCTQQRISLLTNWRTTRQISLDHRCAFSLACPRQY